MKYYYLMTLYSIVRHTNQSVLAKYTLMGPYPQSVLVYVLQGTDWLVCLVYINELKLFALTTTTDDKVAMWLRQWTANPFPSGSMGSYPVIVVPHIKGITLLLPLLLSPCSSMRLQSNSQKVLFPGMYTVTMWSSRSYLESTQPIMIITTVECNNGIVEIL